MASVPITSWQIDGKTMIDFIFLGSKITADGNCSHGIKRCLLLGRKAMSNLNSVLKSRDFTLSTEVYIVEAMVFPVVICESWTIKRAESWKIDGFELWYWKRLLRVPWTARRSNQSILKETNPEYTCKDRCWSWSSQNFGHLMWKAIYWKRPWCWERLEVGGEGEDRGWDGWMA